MEIGRLRFLFLVPLFAANRLLACATCGLSQAFNPKTLIVSGLFILFPLGLVLAVGLRIWKDHKHAASVQEVRREALKK